MKHKPLTFSFRSLAFVFLLFFCTSSFAVSNTFIFGAISMGGNDLYPASTGRNLDSGGFLHGAVGSERIMRNNLYLNTAIGFKFDAVFTDDQNGGEGQALFYRFPIDISVDKLIRDDHRVGLGLSYHLIPRFDATDEQGITEVSARFKNTLGFMIHYAYSIDRNLRIGVRYNNIEYEEKSINFSADASNFAVFIAHKFD